MSIWVWIKMGICAAVLLAGLVMILLAVVKRKNRKLPGLIFQLAAGAVLAVAGAVLLAGPLMMGSRERTLADQRNYVAGQADGNGRLCKWSFHGCSGRSA